MAGPGEGASRGDRALETAAAVYFVGFMFHNGDHLRRGFDVITRHVFWGGMAVGLASAFALALVVLRHPMASRVAIAVGFSAAIGVTAAHLLPEWSAFSDSLIDGHVDALTWVAVLAEIGGAVLMSVAGARALTGTTNRDRLRTAGDEWNTH